MNKQGLRTKYKDLRSALSTDRIDNLSIAIANRLLQLPIWEKTYYHIFLPIEKQKEINTEFIMNILQGKDKHINFKSKFMGNSRTYRRNFNTRKPIRSGFCAAFSL